MAQEVEKLTQSQMQQAEHNVISTMDEERGDPPGEKQLNRETWMRRYFQIDISTQNADVLMLTCCLISGLMDSTIYNAYGTFVSMQTGNTIFVGLGGSNGKDTYKPYGWVKSLTSIACFILGSLFFSRLSRLLGPLRRTTFVTSFLLQSLFIFITACIIQAGVIQGTVDLIPDDIDWKQELAIALLSFQSAGQMVGSRVLGLSEIPTVVVTSVLCDFASDPEIAQPLRRNVKRNRRVLAFLGILVGAVVGGWLSKVTGKMQVALWVAGGIKISVVAAWAFWPKRLQGVVVG